MLDVASHGLAFFNYPKSTRQNLLKPNLFKTNKTDKCSIYKQNNLFIKINKFLLTHLKLIYFMNFIYKTINILQFKILRNNIKTT